MPPSHRHADVIRDEIGTGSGPVLEVQGLSKHYLRGSALSVGPSANPLRAVEDVSFTLNAGETLGIVGESGCGKSTLARTLLRLEEPTRGEVSFAGENIFQMNRAELKRLRRQVQIVFQDPYASLNPRMSVADIVAEPWRIHTDMVPTSARPARIRELLESVGLRAEHADRYPHEFSGGQRQRIGIARALALEPSLIVLDEPVSALDVSVQAQVINLLVDIQRTRGIAFLFISHDLSIVRHLSDRVAVMYLGRIVEIGSQANIYAHPRHPYTKALLSAQPIVDFQNTESNRIVLKGEIPSPAEVFAGCPFRTRCWKAQPRCEQERPTLVTIEGAQQAACFFPE